MLAEAADNTELTLSPTAPSNDKITAEAAPTNVLETTSQDEIDLHIIDVYSQDDLNSVIPKNKHLQRVKADKCQLVEDIQAHAVKIKEPAYLYLWGYMLAWGVCVDRNPDLGMRYIHQAAKQG